jgi:hypothetical protein
VKYTNHDACTGNAQDESAIGTACFELMSFHSTDHLAYYEDVLVSLFKAQSKMKHPEVQHYSWTTDYQQSNAPSELPIFCIENLFPFATHAYMYCEYCSLYESAFRLIRQLCSGFKEDRMTREIEYQNDGFINANDNCVDGVHGTRNKIDAEIVSYNTIYAMYEKTFAHILYNHYRIIFYNRDSHRVNHNIDIYMHMASPPCWNVHHNTPVDALYTVLENFREEVHNCTNVHDETKDYIDQLCQQVLLRIIYIRCKRCVTKIPMEYRERILPPELLSVIPSDALVIKPKHQSYHSALEPKYISMVNGKIEKLINEEIKFPVSWFGIQKPKSLTRKMSPEQEFELDVYWADVLDDMFNKYCNARVKNNTECANDAPARAASEWSEETARFVAYALSKNVVKKPAINSTDGSMAALSDSTFDNNAAMVHPADTIENEEQHLLDVNMTNEKYPTKLSTIEESTIEYHEVAQSKDQTACDTTDDNDVEMNDCINDMESEYYKSEENDDEDSAVANGDDDSSTDEDVEAEVYYEEKHHFVGGSNVEEAINIDDDDDDSDDDEIEEEDDGGEEQSDAPDDNENQGDGPIDGNSDSNAGNETEVDDRTESDDEESSDYMYDNNNNKTEINDGTDEEIVRTNMEGTANQILPTETILNNTMVEGSTGTFGVSIRADDDGNDNVAGKPKIADSDTVEEEICDKEDFAEDVNVGKNEHNVVAADEGRSIQNDFLNEEAPCYDNSKNSRITSSTYEGGRNESTPRDESMLTTPVETSKPTIDAIVPLEDAVTRSDINSSTLRQNDSEAGYDAEDSQDAGTDEEDHECPNETRNIDDGAIQQAYFFNTSTTTQAQDPPLVEHKAASTLIDKGYEPDTQEGPTDMDFLHHNNDPEAGYEAEDSQDAGTEEEIDDHHPNVEAVSTSTISVPIGPNIESSTPLDDTAQHQENISTLIDTGYEQAKDLPLVEHKAVSMLIDKGYEPDTQEGPTDMDFIHHNNDPEAGYEAEDSQDAGTEEEIDDHHPNVEAVSTSTISVPIVPNIELSTPPNDTAQHQENISTLIDTGYEQAKDPPLVEHKAVSTLIDKGYEPDTQEGPTDVDFIHHDNDPEAGYEAEDSQDAGTEEEIDDHHPNVEAVSTSTISVPIVPSIESSTPPNEMAQHQGNISTLIDTGYEPDPESQGQTDVDGVPQQIRHLESGYDGEESQCHTEDEIHTEDEHQTEISCSRSPSEVQLKDINSDKLHQQVTEPATSIDGMIADDEMEAESSEVEKTDGGSSSLQVAITALDTATNKNANAQTMAGNLLTQIATNIQNTHSYDSPAKDRIISDVPNPRHAETPQNIDYMPQMDGDDEDDDESSDSVRSKPGDEISCPMSDTHSSQSSVGMRSAKSTASREGSQPPKEVIPSVEIKAKTSSEQKKMAMKGTPRKRAIKTASAEPEQKRITRSAGVVANPTAILTRKRKAALMQDESSFENTSNTSAGKRSRPPQSPIANSYRKSEASMELRSKTGRPPKAPANLLESRIETPVQRRSTRSTSSRSPSVVPTDNTTTAHRALPSPTTNRITRSMNATKRITRSMNARSR